MLRRGSLSVMLLLTVTAVGLAGCGGNESVESTPAASAQVAATPTAAAASEAPKPASPSPASTEAASPAPSQGAAATAPAKTEPPAATKEPEGSKPAETAKPTATVKPAETAKPVETAKPSPSPSAAPTTAAAAADPESLYKNNCLACHGVNLEGKVGPNISKVGAVKEKEDILKQILKGGSRMPGFESKLTAAEAEMLASWLAEKM